MTAAERLMQISGRTGSAAALLLAIGAGATTGVALNDYSSIEIGTAAEHLLSERVITQIGGGSAVKMASRDEKDLMEMLTIIMASGVLYG